jgi:HD-GYP domain-containing protein (c-di-GMP phosphodiesterase class II)
LCCERGQIFRVNWCFRLQQLGVDVIYFSRGEKLRVMDYLGYDPEKMSAVQKERPEPEDTLIAEPPDLPDFSPKHFFTRLKNFTGLHLELALDDLEEFLEAVQRDGVVVTFIRDLWQYDPRLLVHSSNTCLLGLAFTRRLGWQKKEAHAFSLGALLHDVGMTQVPRHIFRKMGKLKQEEWLLIKRHPFTGYTLLKNFTDLNSATLHMVREHHENGDGSGYPRGLHMAEIHPWARILRIVDSYEAMTAERYWRQARPPKDALWEIRLGWEQRRIYDPVYLKRYIKFLGGG